MYLFFFFDIFLVYIEGGNINKKNCRTNKKNGIGTNGTRRLGPFVA